MKHTPGPWAWRGTPGRSELHSAHGQVLGYASYEGMWPGSYEEGTDAANMRLISAAPDLLAVLLRLRRGDLHQRVRSLYDDAQSAIAKATGESP